VNVADDPILVHSSLTCKCATTGGGRLAQEFPTRNGAGGCPYNIAVSWGRNMRPRMSALSPSPWRSCALPRSCPAARVARVLSPVEADHQWARFEQGRISHQLETDANGQSQSTSSRHGCSMQYKVAGADLVAPFRVRQRGAVRRGVSAKAAEKFARHSRHDEFGNGSARCTSIAAA